MFMGISYAKFIDQSLTFFIRQCMVHLCTWCEGIYLDAEECGWWRRQGTLCMCVGGGGLIIMPLCICTVSWKCEVYCMHLNWFYVPIFLCRIPWCDCCLSVNYIGVCVCVCNYSLMLHNAQTINKFPCMILAWTTNNLIFKKKKSPIFSCTWS